MREARQARRHRAFVADRRRRQPVRPGDDRYRDNRHQRRRHAFGHARQEKHDGECGGKQQPDHLALPPDVRHLCHKNQNAERVHKAGHYRARDVTHHACQPQQPEEDLDDAAQHQGRQNVADAVLMHHRANNQRHRTRRRGDHRRTPAEQRHTEAQHNGRHQAHFRVDARNDRERNHFRDQRQRSQNARQRFAHQQARCAQHVRDRKLRHRPSRSLSIRHEYLQVFYNERRPLRAAGTGDGTEQGDKTPALRPRRLLNALVRKAVLNGFTEVTAL
ncbi:hypothetical protein BN128_1746 [Cronobacter sakazakii 696]|nr:hypothetical protein BN128_1746 [Cronobacter sakazakii 696]